MKKNIFLIIAFSACIILLYSCKKLTEEKVYTSVSTDKIYSTAEGCEAVMSSAYAPFFSSQYYGGNTLELKCAASTYFYNNQLRDHGKVEYHNFTLTSASSFVNTTWQYSYKVIGTVNDVIFNVPDAPIDIADKKKILGEAYFLRAWVFFDNYIFWGGIPLRTQPSSFSNVNIPRAPADSVVKQILADIDSAKANLPEPSQAIPGRPSKYAAYALAMKVYLKLAGNDPSSPYWQKVIDEGMVIYNSHAFQLVKPFADLWDPAKQPNSPETIFEIQFSSNQPSGRSPAYSFLPSKSEFSGEASTSARVRINRETYDYHVAQYPTDPRIAATYITSYTRAGKTTPTLCYPNVTLNPTKNGEYWPYLKKYLGTVVGNSSDGNLILLRYADVLLMIAEAENEVNGPNSGYQYVNEVLSRARYISPNSSAADPADWSGMSQDEFRQRIMDERRYELIGEMQEYFDVRRRGVEYFKNVCKMHNDHLSNQPLMVGDPPNFEYTIPLDDATMTRAMLMPIPNNELNANPLITLKDQNPGY